MERLTKTIDGSDYAVIVASEGKTFRRIHDGFTMGGEIVLGVDYSTGVAREDKPEYYEEVDETEETE